MNAHDIYDLLKSEPHESIGRMPACVVSSLPLRDQSCDCTYFFRQMNQGRSSWVSEISLTEVFRRLDPRLCEATCSVEVVPDEHPRDYLLDKQA